jgi:hypothetical protein
MKETVEKSEVIKFLEKEAESECLWEILDHLTWKGKEVYCSGPDEHRWYTIYDKVYEINGQFVSCQEISHKSEMQLDSDIWFDGPPTEMFQFMESHEVTTTTYKPKEP